METEQAQLKLDAKVTEKELIELEARITAVNDEIHEKERDIQELDKEITSLQTMLENMKKAGQKYCTWAFPGFFLKKKNIILIENI